MAQHSVRNGIPAHIPPCFSSCTAVPSGSHLRTHCQHSQLSSVQYTPVGKHICAFMMHQPPEQESNQAQTRQQDKHGQWSSLCSACSCRTQCHENVGASEQSWDTVRAHPSNVEVPRPSSSSTTRESGVAWRSTVAASLHSTKKVDSPDRMRSCAPAVAHIRPLAERLQDEPM